MLTTSASRNQPEAAEAVRRWGAALSSRVSKLARDSACHSQQAAQCHTRRRRRSRTADSWPSAELTDSAIC